MRQKFETDSTEECSCMDDMATKKLQSVLFIAASIAGTYAIIAIGSLTY